MTTEPLIRLRGVRSFRGDVEILHDVSLDVHPGESVALLGPSGSGKTTLFETILGFLEAEGEVTVFGERMNALPEPRRAWLRRQIGVLFQEGALFTSLSVHENIVYARSEEGLPEEALERLADDVLGFVGLPGFADRMPDELSGGQQQRVAVARALATQPKLLLVDEPTQGLDPISARLVVDELRAAVQRRVTLLTVTHQIEYAVQLADRLVVLNEGRIVYDGPPVGLARVDDDYVRRYMAAVLENARALGEVEA